MSNVTSLQLEQNGTNGVHLPDGECYALTYSRDNDRVVTKARAQKIVKCVNDEWKIDMHDEMVKALKKSLLIIDASPVRFVGTINMVKGLIDQADQKGSGNKPASVWLPVPENLPPRKANPDKFDKASGASEKVFVMIDGMPTTGEYIHEIGEWRVPYINGDVKPSHFMFIPTLK